MKARHLAIPLGGLALLALTSCLATPSGSSSYLLFSPPQGMRPGMMGGGMMGGGMMGPGMMGSMQGMMGSGMMGGWGSTQAFRSNGERIYYSGLSSSGWAIPSYGGPMWLNMHGGGCVNCHGVDGRGGIPVLMGSANPPDISYQALAGGHRGPGDSHSHQPYTEALLKRAIVRGINAEGKPLDPTMPRWQMSDTDLQDLIEYLKTFPRPELLASSREAQISGGHIHDSDTSVRGDDSHAPQAVSNDSSGSPSYILLLSLLVVLAVTFGTVFYLKRKGSPASEAVHSTPGARN